MAPFGHVFVSHLLLSSLLVSFKFKSLPVFISETLAEAVFTIITSPLILQTSKGNSFPETQQKRLRGRSKLSRRHHSSIFHWVQNKVWRGEILVQNMVYWPAVLLVSIILM